MQAPKQQAAHIYTVQRMEDVGRCLQLVNRFNELAKAYALMAAETERDFVFGIMSCQQANACAALYEFIFHGAAMAPSTPPDRQA